jgi:hypothetical protein
LGVITTTEATALAAPMGLVKRVGDRSIILHWDPIVGSSLAGYHVYREPSAPRLVERSNSLLLTHHSVDLRLRTA